MSDTNSDSQSTRSAAEIPQGIADFVVKHTDELSDVFGVNEFSQCESILRWEL